MTLLTLMSFGVIIVSTSMWLFGRLSPDEKSQFLESLDEAAVQ